MDVDVCGACVGRPRAEVARCAQADQAPAAQLHVLLRHYLRVATDPQALCSTPRRVWRPGICWAEGASGAQRALHANGEGQRARGLRRERNAMKYHWKHVWWVVLSACLSSKHGFD
jgi:hypothetical protein